MLRWAETLNGPAQGTSAGAALSPSVAAGTACLPGAILNCPMQIRLKREGNILPALLLTPPQPLPPAESCLWRMRVVTCSTSGISTCQKVGVGGFFFGKRPLQRRKTSHRLSACVSVPDPSKTLQFRSDLSHLHSEYCLAVDTAQQNPLDHWQHREWQQHIGKAPSMFPGWIKN